MYGSSTTENAQMVFTADIFTPTHIQTYLYIQIYICMYIHKCVHGVGAKKSERLLHVIWYS